jgi:rSAM/selenodomain-associated transferase 2
MSPDPEQLRPALISVIVPVLNEADAIDQLVGLQAPEVELIIADGGSTDGTAELARQRGLHVVLGQPGRGRQMNRGAAEARREILLFLHADTRLPEGWADAVRETLARPNVSAGAFRFRIDASGWRYRLLERLVRLRSTPYGDQGIFLRREVFERVGRFPEWPILEDPELIRRARKHGRIRLAPLDASTSPRRCERFGLLRTIWTNQKCLWAWRLGLSPDRIAVWRSTCRTQPADDGICHSSRPVPAKRPIAT